MDRCRKLCGTVMRLGWFCFMHVRIALIPLLVVLCFPPLLSLGQKHRSDIPPERKPIDWFYDDANFHSNTLLLKVLQFTAPYPGYYQATSLDKDGNAFSGRIVPDWAVQGSQNAKFDAALLSQVRQMMAQLDIPSTPAVIEPQPGQVHTAIIFYEGGNLSRLSYNGPIPEQLNAILEIIREELLAAAKNRLEEFAAHQRLMEETYGDWQNRNGITLVRVSRMHGCKGNRALIVTMTGQRKSTGTAEPSQVSVYHALVFYPGGAVTGSGSGGRSSDDPVSSEVVIWTLPNAMGLSSENTSERKLEILYDAIEATVTVDGKTFELSRGNMFIIRIDDNWVPTASQLNEKLDEPATPQSALDKFKSIFTNDGSIQQLELDQ